MKCRHATEIDAIAYYGPGDSRPEKRTRCDFVDNEPERFMNAPRWMLRMIGGGNLITNDDCRGCPAFERAYPKGFRSIAGGLSEGEE